MADYSYGSQDLNCYLRCAGPGTSRGNVVATCNNETAVYRDLRDALDEAFQEAPFIDQPCVLFRGLGDPAELLGRAAQAPATLVGRKFVDRGYPSTAVDRDSAAAFRDFRLRSSCRSLFLGAAR